MGKKLGRPRRVPGTVSYPVLSVRVTQKEKDRIFEFAHRRGLSPSDYVRRCCLQTIAAEERGHD